MRKKLAFVTCGILVTTLLLSGCSDTASFNAAQNEDSQTEAVESAESSAAESEVSEVETSGEGTEESDVAMPELSVNTSGRLDAKWLKMVKEYYASLNVKENRHADVYVDGIRGGAYFSPEFNDAFFLSYHTMDGTQSITLSINPLSETATIDFDVQYDDSRFYVAGWDVELDQLESYVDSLFEDVTEYEIYDVSATEKNLENLKEDVKVLYSRLIVFADQAVSPLNTTLEDYGIDFGKKYRSFDPTQPTSTEVVIENGHVFENGICKDCGMTWTKYVNRTLAAFEGKTVEEDAERTEWFSIYGQDSYEGLPGWGYVQYSSDNVYDAELSYVHPDDDGFIYCTLFVSHEDDNSVFISLSFDLEEKYYLVGDNSVQTKYHYYLYLGAKAGDFAEIFASKEALRDACELYLTISGKDQDAWENVSDAEIKALFDADGCNYYTRDEYFDLFWEQHETIFAALDKGMVWFDTSLKDLGFNYR